MKALIITRCINESPDSEKIRAFLSATDILKIAVNDVDCKADIRLFLDCDYWQKYLKFPEQLMTRSGGMDIIPEDIQERFIFFNIAKEPCTSINTELYACPSSLGSAIDLAYKIGIKELLLIADNKIKEDGTQFHHGYCDIAKQITDFYNTRMNLYQFTNGNFNLPVKSLQDFTKGA